MISDSYFTPDLGIIIPDDANYMINKVIECLSLLQQPKCRSSL